MVLCILFMQSFCKAIVMLSNGPHASEESAWSALEQVLGKSVEINNE
jgi:hypothetical protein